MANPADCISCLGAPGRRSLPFVEPSMCEGAQFSNLWDSEEPQRIEENKTFWLLYEGALFAAIDSQSHLSRIV